MDLNFGVDAINEPTYCNYDNRALVTVSVGMSNQQPEQGLYAQNLGHDDL